MRLFAKRDSGTLGRSGKTRGGRGWGISDKIAAAFGCEGDANRRVSVTGPGVGGGPCDAPKWKRGH